MGKDKLKEKYSKLKARYKEAEARIEELLRVNEKYKKSYEDFGVDNLYLKNENKKLLSWLESFKRRAKDGGTTVLNRVMVKGKVKLVPESKNKAVKSALKKKVVKKAAKSGSPQWSHKILKKAAASKRPTTPIKTIPPVKKTVKKAAKKTPIKAKGFSGRIG